MTLESGRTRAQEGRACVIEGSRLYVSPAVFDRMRVAGVAPDLSLEPWAAAAEAANRMMAAAGLTPREMRVLRHEGPVSVVVDPELRDPEPPAEPDGSVTDDAAWHVVLAEVLRCAASWEPGARVLGNVRAGDIVRACSDALHVPALPDDPALTIVDGETFDLLLQMLDRPPAPIPEHVRREIAARRWR